MAQRFYNLVLLPRVRDDIAEYKRLNFHLYMALKKALFKPAAWFKGGDAGRAAGPAWEPLAVREAWGGHVLRDGVLSPAWRGPGGSVGRRRMEEDVEEMLGVPLIGGGGSQSPRGPFVVFRAEG